MNEIKCPHCQKVFKADESGYAEIVKQARDSEFERMARESKATLELEKSVLKNEFEGRLKDNAQAKDKEILELRFKLENSADKEKLAIVSAVSDIEKERDSLKGRLEFEVKTRDEEIARLKDYKLKLSTKMVGESLEQHCETLFNRHRAVGFQYAAFGKDNDAKDGTKGDYIFRECDTDGNEIVSIMFEMKNEEDTSATKKKNEDFLDKLHKDREKKGCEYAVLVSLLEPENEYYNDGIVDLSHFHNKMYFIRPQFFIPLITALRNTGRNALEYKRELASIKQQSLDVTNFEQKMMDFKAGFTNNARLVKDHFHKAIKEIDTVITHLQKVKEALNASYSQLSHAGNKVDDLTIRKLTHANPTMKTLFDGLKNKTEQAE